MKVFPNYNNIQAPMYIGTYTEGNYSEFKADGTLRYNGDATVWKDMISNLFGQRLNSTAGSVAYDYDENALDFTAGSISNAADRVQGNLEINHEFKVGTGITFRPHIHWFQDIVSSAITYAYVITTEYRLQRNNYEKTSSWTAITCTAGTDDVFDFTGESDGTYNQISRFPDITIDCGISDTVQFRMARTDALGGNQLVYFMDMHGMCDSGGGSSTELVK